MAQGCDPSYLGDRDRKTASSSTTCATYQDLSQSKTNKRMVTFGSRYHKPFAASLPLYSPGSVVVVTHGSLQSIGTM